MAPRGGPWPNGCWGAVSLTFDDGMRSHWEVAVPLLERYGLRGTFYVPPRGEQWPQRAQAWRRVAEADHELGNHTLTHPCSRGFASDRGARGLEDMTLEEMATDIDAAEERIAAVAGPGPRSFAYPCYQDHVGEGPRRQSYVPLVAARFVAGRLRGERANYPWTADLWALWSFPVERYSGAELIGLAEQAAAAGRWCILTFHGIHEGHLPIGEGDLEALCRHLQTHRGRIWTVPVATAAAAIAAWRCGQSSSPPEEQAQDGDGRGGTAGVGTSPGWGAAQR